MKAEKNLFPIVIKSTAVITAAAAAVLALLHHFFQQPWLLSAAITAFTFCYHFSMRLLVGHLVPRILRNPVQVRWFRERPLEKKLYTALKVKRWKDHMPTYDPASFSLKENSLEQIVRNSCVSEAVHEVIIVFSFVPCFLQYSGGLFRYF